jgi:hypothetical protein
MGAIRHENGSIVHDAAGAIGADRDVKCLIDHPSLNSKAETALESVNVLSLNPPSAIVRAAALVHAMEKLLNVGLIDEALLLVRHLRALLAAA